MAIEVVDFPIKNSDLNHSYVKLPEGNLITHEKSEDVPQHSTAMFVYQRVYVMQIYTDLNELWLFTFFLFDDVDQNPHVSLSR